MRRTTILAGMAAISLAGPATISTTGPGDHSLAEVADAQSGHEPGSSGRSGPTEHVAGGVTVAPAGTEIGFEVSPLPADCERPGPAFGAGPADSVVQPANRYAAAHRDTFAGLWGHAGSFRVAFTDDLNGHQARLTQVIDSPIPVALVRARWTMAELEALRDHITTRMSQPVAGMGISSVGVDVINNRVAVMLTDVTDAVREALSTDYPADMLCLEEGRIQTLTG